MHGCTSVSSPQKMLLICRTAVGPFGSDDLLGLSSCPSMGTAQVRAGLGPYGLLQWGHPLQLPRSPGPERSGLGPKGHVQRGCSLSPLLGSWGISARLGPCGLLQWGRPLRLPCLLGYERSGLGPEGLSQRGCSVSLTLGSWGESTGLGPQGLLQWGLLLLLRPCWLRGRFELGPASTHAGPGSCDLFRWGLC